MIRKLLSLVAIVAGLVLIPSSGVEAARFRSRCRSVCASRHCVTAPAADAAPVSVATGVETTLNATRCSYQGCKSVEVTRITSRSVAVGAVSLAQSKAEQMAARGQLLHLGGGFGGGSFEGIGFGASPDQAVANCCGWGSRSPIDVGIAAGVNGFYACVLYR